VSLRETGRRKNTSDVDTAASTSDARLPPNLSSLPEGFTKDLPWEVLVWSLARVSRIAKRSTGGESFEACSALCFKSKNAGSPL
jgi:hypothetical protein